MMKNIRSNHRHSDVFFAADYGYGDQIILFNCIQGGVKMKQGDIIIYACVIIGAGIGLILNHVFPGVLIGLGIGYLIKSLFKKED